ncbi:HRDC domain-containing protein [Cohnella algarum]|uniref:HRDC domain-containing protein n=1 Tax=Cohnella algarum TaxID=2044859 RepID=UPI001967EF85|nr:HRDC domain-containing protein [Cohnella algarum]MBN2979880.1 HRDC domain-containing protein [Cohnella algarum]
MEVVFLNRFERTAGLSDVERGQVFIGEEQGMWTAGWQELRDAETAERELWYEGASWEELLASFRYGIAKRMKDGFRPLLDSMLEDAPYWERTPALPGLLACYADLNDREKELEPLRQWRRAKSAEERRAAYLVATNRELQMLAVYVPRTMEELGQIPGFGPRKTERYGSELLELLKPLPREHSFPLNWVERKIDLNTWSEWTFRQKEEKYGKSLSLVREKRKLLAGIRQGHTLDELERELNVPRRQLIERIEKLDEEGYDVSMLVDKELAGMPQTEIDGALKAMKDLGDRFLKPLVKRIYGVTEEGGGEAERCYEKVRFVRIRYRRGAQAV